MPTTCRKWYCLMYFILKMNFTSHGSQNTIGLQPLFSKAQQNHSTLLDLCWTEKNHFILEISFTIPPFSVSDLWCLNIGVSSLKRYYFPQDTEWPKKFMVKGLRYQVTYFCFFHWQKGFWYKQAGKEGAAGSKQICTEVGLQSEDNIF